MRDYHINIFYSPADEGYIADIPDLRHCSAFGVTPNASQPRGPCNPHLTRLLPTSMTRSWLIARGERGSGATAGAVVAGQARRIEISPERKRVRRGPSASTSAPLASTPATLPVTTAPSGSSSRTSLPW